MVIDWYIFAILALVLIGIQRFLYKVSVERRCDTGRTTLAFMGTVAFVGSILFVIQKESVPDIRFLFIISALNSCAFLAATVCHMEALKRLPTSVVYPIIRLNLVVVVIFSILFFKDHLSCRQVVGIIFALLAMVILTRQLNDKKTTGKQVMHGSILVLIALLSGAVATISSKFAALYTNKMAFIALSYILSTIFSFVLINYLPAGGASKNNNNKESFMIGCAMGIINVAGFYSYLKALSTGSLSIIASIVGMHFVIAVILSVLIYREKLTPLRTLGIMSTIFSMILLRIE